MKEVFADALYWVAALRPNDPCSDRTRLVKAKLGLVELVTTEEVHETLDERDAWTWNSGDSHRRPSPCPRRIHSSALARGTAIQTPGLHRAGIPSIKYNLTISGVIRADPTPGRGGALYSTPD